MLRPMARPPTLPLHDLAVPFMTPRLWEVKQFTVECVNRPEINQDVKRDDRPGWEV